MVEDDTPPALQTVGRDATLALRQTGPPILQRLTPERLIGVGTGGTRLQMRVENARRELVAGVEDAAGRGAGRVRKVTASMPRP